MSDELSHKSRPRKVKAEGSGLETGEGAGPEGGAQTSEDRWLGQLIRNLRNKQLGYKEQRDKLLNEYRAQREKRTQTYSKKWKMIHVRHREEYLMRHWDKELMEELAELENLHEEEGNELLEKLKGPQDEWLQSRYQKYLEKVQEKDWEEARKLRQELGTWYERLEKLNTYSRRYEENKIRRERRLEIQQDRLWHEYKFLEHDISFREIESLDERLMKQLDELEELYVKEKNELLEELEGLQDEWLQSRYQKYLNKYLKEALEEIRILRHKLETPYDWFDEFTKALGVGRYKKGSMEMSSEETSNLENITALRHKMLQMVRIPKPTSVPVPRGQVRKPLGEAQSSFISHESSPSTSFRQVPRSLRLMCEGILQKKQIVREECQSDTLTWSVSMQKDFKRYVGERVHHKGAVLQAPGSEVILSIPSGLKAFVMGHIHTDPKPFLHAIPDDECLVAPIVDYTCVYLFDESSPPGAWFKISIPHCITNKKHLSEVRVRHGDIYKGLEFTEIPSDDCLFEVDEHHITIFTRHFSQFICTVCCKGCQGSARAFTFGGLTPLTLPPVHSSLRVYMCSPLYRINDYRQKLQEIEGRLQIKRHLVDESDVTWNPDDFREGEELCVAVQADWDPKKPIKRNEAWDKDTRKLVQVRKVSEMLDMKHCHICKTDPSTVANFSFTEPETATENSTGPQVALKFSGRLEMTTRGHRMLYLLESDFHVIPTELCPATQSDDHLRLHRVTELIICEEWDLVGFGLRLGFTFDQVKQKRTNNSTLIQNAGMDVVVEWWDACTESYEDKVELLVKVVDDIGKSKFAARVREIMRKVDNEP